MSEANKDQALEIPKALRALADRIQAAIEREDYRAAAREYQSLQMAAYFAGQGALNLARAKIEEN